MDGTFRFPEFNLVNSQNVNLTLRIGMFKINANDRRKQKEFKEILNNQPIVEIQGGIKMFFMELLMHYSTRLLKPGNQTKASKTMASKVEVVTNLLEVQNIEMSLAYVVQHLNTWCYMQVYGGDSNWEIAFEIDSITKEVKNIDIFDSNVENPNLYFESIFEKWKDIFLRKPGIKSRQTRKSEDHSNLLVADEDGVNKGLDGGSFSRIQNDDHPIVNDSGSPVYVSKVYDKTFKFQFWQSWAQWVFMFQDHETMDGAYKEIFMEYFMTLVAKELFHVPGKVVNVIRHKNIPETKDLGRVTTFHTGGHIEANHVSHDDEEAEGRILVLYKNLPHGESFENYERLIRETGLHKDTIFVYIGKGADPKYCEKFASLEQITTPFYIQATTGHSGSRRAAATGKGNHGTKKLMVDGSDEEDEDGKSEEDRMKDIVKEFREVEKRRTEKEERKARAHDIFMDLRTNHQKNHKEIDHELWRDFKIQHQRKREEEGGVLSV